ncbi:hypothetical protein [Brevundimonas vesicularis]|uniref:hypothetical protein n=1 Tax=Brevundimonas vesicularis TaxID=41276 RepID=UPI000DD6C368|nr:hypothetical protein [Brevundimonas vesicularis]
MREGGLLGWATAALVKLDDEVPGLIARTLTAAPMRRQAIFAALAAREEKVGVIEDSNDLFPRSFAEVVRHGRAKDIPDVGQRNASPFVFPVQTEAFTRGALQLKRERPDTLLTDFLEDNEIDASVHDGGGHFETAHQELSRKPVPPRHFDGR